MSGLLFLTALCSVLIAYALPEIPTLPSTTQPSPKLTPDEAFAKCCVLSGIDTKDSTCNYTELTKLGPGFLVASIMDLAFQRYQHVQYFHCFTNGVDATERCAKLGVRKCKPLCDFPKFASEPMDWAMMYTRDCTDIEGFDEGVKVIESAKLEAYKE